MSEHAKPGRKCWCGCGGTPSPGRFFIATHDAKAYSYLLKKYRGEYGNDGLANIILELGFDIDKNRLCPESQRVDGDWKPPSPWGRVLNRIA